MERAGGFVTLSGSSAVIPAFLRRGLPGVISGGISGLEDEGTELYDRRLPPASNPRYSVAIPPAGGRAFIYIKSANPQTVQDL